MSVIQTFPQFGPIHRHGGAIAATRGPSRLEWTLTFVSFVVIVASPFIVGDQPQGAESLNPTKMLENVSASGDSAKQFLLLAVYAACGIALVLKERPRAWLFIGGPLGFLLLVTFVSAIWSVNPEVTIRRSIALSGVVIMGLYTGLRFPVRQLITLVFFAGTAILSFSLVLAILSPLQGTDFEGRLRGVYADKNHMASFSALTLLTALAITGMGRGSRLEITLRILGAALAIVCMTLAHSTAVIPILAGAMAMLMLGFVILRASPKLLATLPLAASLGVLVLLIAVSNAGQIAEALGKDADISGRTLIWAFSFKLIALRPFAGWGLGSVWTGGDSPGAVFWATTHLGVPHAHNGFIQLALDLGFLGVALFAASVVYLLMKTLWLTIYLRQPGMPWSFAFLTLYLVANYSEALLWTGNEPLTTLFVALVVRTNVEYRRATHRRSSYGGALAGAIA